MVQSTQDRGAGSAPFVFKEEKMQTPDWDILIRALDPAIRPQDYKRLRLEAGLQTSLLNDPGTGLKTVAEKALAWASQPGNHLLELMDPAYPECLRALPDPPKLLYLTGRAELLNGINLAFVGSRKATESGRANARRLASEASAVGFHIVSGAAAGIDRAAHEAALESGGSTLAVLGCGIDQVYPRSHRSLYERLSTEGLLVSEFAPGTPARPWQFPVRNRIISGLSAGLVVVEAALRSGSLVSARLALEQGREVFAVPGSILNPQVEGCHQLIRDGAHLCAGLSDILLEIALPDHSGSAQQDHPGSQDSGSLPPVLEKLLADLSWEPEDPSWLARRLSLAPGEVMSHLMQLVLQGWVSEEEGRFRRCR